MCRIVLLNEWQGFIPLFSTETDWFKNKVGRAKIQVLAIRMNCILLSENKENISTLFPVGHWKSTVYKPSSLNMTFIFFIFFLQFLSLKSLLDWCLPENNILLHPFHSSTWKQMEFMIKELNMTVINNPLLLIKVCLIYKKFKRKL